MKYQSLLSFWLILGFSACTTVANLETGTPMKPTPPSTIASDFIASTQTSEEDIQPTQVLHSPVLESLIEKAKDDLAQRLSIPVTEITLVEAREVVWPDASLGCPQPGMLYAQVETEGFLIRLEAQGEIYEYHTDTNKALILCEPPPEDNTSKKDKNVDDGWPNRPKDDVIVKLTPTKRP